MRVHWRHFDLLDESSTTVPHGRSYWLLLGTGTVLVQLYRCSRKLPVLDLVQHVLASS